VTLEHVPRSVLKILYSSSELKLVNR
jgi:hypothetical protein